MIINATWTCSRGEQIDQIAYNVYGDESKAAEILNMNPGVEKLVFDGGEVLNLPMIDTDEDVTEAAPWR